MKTIITIICVIAFMLSFAGCSNNAEHKENGSDSIINESIESTTQDTETNSGNAEEISDGTTEDTTVVELKDGDILEDGSVYFDDVVVNSAEDIKNILEKYADEKKDVVFTTPEYTGIILRTEDSYIVSKKSDAFTEDVIYMDIGIVNTDRCEY